MTAIFIGGATFSFLLFVWWLIRTGKKSQERDQMKETLDDIHTAKMAHDRLRHDPDTAARVRSRFTR